MLERGRPLGLFGPADLGDAVIHARWFARTVSTPRSFVDLGSGGGLPGLVLAWFWPDTLATLVEVRERCVSFLQDAVERLRLASRVRIVPMRAEEAGRDEARRGQSDLVVARSFGRPAVTAECSAPFLRLDGRLVVSEPPVSDQKRWDRAGLELLGLEPLATVHIGESSHAASYRVLRQHRPCSERFPRRVGVPTKRPLF